MGNLHEQALSALQLALKGRTGALLRTLETVFEERSLHAALQTRRQLAGLRAIAHFLHNADLQRMCADLQSAMLQVSSDLPQGFSEARSRPYLRLALQITWHFSSHFSWQFSEISTSSARVPKSSLHAPDLPAVLLQRVRHLQSQCNTHSATSQTSALPDTLRSRWNALRAAAVLVDVLPETVRVTDDILEALLRWEQSLLAHEQQPASALLRILAARLQALLEEASATALLRRSLESRYGEFHSRMQILLKQAAVLLAAFPTMVTPRSDSLRKGLCLALRLVHGVQRWQAVEALASSALAGEWRCLLMRVLVRLQDDLALAASGAGRACTGLVPESMARELRGNFRRQSRAATAIILECSFGKKLAEDRAMIAERRGLADQESETAVHFLRAWGMACAQRSGPHFVPDDALVAVCRLAQQALLVGDLALYEVLATLRQCVTLISELQLDAGAVLQLVDSVLDCVYRPTVCQNRERVLRRLLTLESRLSVLASATDADLPLSLARNVRALLEFRVPQLFQVVSREDFSSQNRQLLLELRMLATGARALRVYRIASLSAALAQFHEVLADAAESPANLLRSSAAEGLLEDAHSALRRGLNQAAARQEVSECRSLLGALYDWLAWNGEQAGVRQDFVRESGCLMAQIESASSHEARLHDLHTLKGNAAMYRCETIVQLCHRGEQEILLAGNKESGLFIREPAALWPLLSQLRAAVDSLGPGLPPRQAVSGATGLAAEVGSSTSACTSTPGHCRWLSGRLRRGLHSIAEVLQGVDEAQGPVRLHLVQEMLHEQLACATQLQEDLSESTHVCFARLAPRLRRVVEDTANRNGKAAGLEIRNTSLCVDRQVLERLVAPLEHLLRNAIVHGIEGAAQRLAVGKPDCGRVVLGLERRESGLELYVEDDGAGVAGHALPERLFQAGFSTRALVDADAGHGIGLAMVKATVEALGGTVTVSSSAGQGTCFRLQVPDTGGLGDIHSMPL